MTVYSIVWYCDGGENHDYYAQWETIRAVNGTSSDALTNSFDRIAHDRQPGNARAAIVTTTYLH